MSKIARKIRIIRGLTLGLGVFGAALLIAPATLATATPVQSPSHAAVAVPAPAPLGVAGNSSIGTISAIGHIPGMPPPCDPIPKGDYAHVSSKGPPPQVSAHAYWEKNNCKVNKALVTVQLQEYYSNGTWKNKGTLGSKTIPSGKIPLAKRPNGRDTCTKGTALTGWRSVVWVGTIGEFGLNEETTPAQNIHCRV